MITAGIVCGPRSLTCCVFDHAVRWPRYQATHRNDASRRKLCAALLRNDVEQLVLSVTPDHIDPIGFMFWRSRPGVLVFPEPLLDDIAALLLRRPGRRIRAAFLARMPTIPSWSAALRPLAVGLPVASAQDQDIL